MQGFNILDNNVARINSNFFSTSVVGLHAHTIAQGVIPVARWSLSDEEGFSHIGLQSRQWNDHPVQVSNSIPLQANRANTFGALSLPDSATGFNDYFYRVYGSIQLHFADDITANSFFHYFSLMQKVTSDLDFNSGGTALNHAHICDLHSTRREVGASHVFDVCSQAFSFRGGNGMPILFALTLFNSSANEIRFGFKAYLSLWRWIKNIDTFEDNRGN